MDAADASWEFIELMTDLRELGGSGTVFDLALSGLLCGSDNCTTLSR